MSAGKPFYQAAAGTNVVIATGPAILEKIIFGKDVASSVVEVSDSVDDGNGNIQIHIEGSTLMTQTGGELLVGASFVKGICTDITNKTNLTFVWRPQAA